MIVAVVGATATGKSRLAVGLAQELVRTGRPAEVVSADSMLLYRGMDVGTAKPSEAERGGIPHHLVDVLGVTESASVAAFQQQARAVIADCRVRGVVPVLAGGSALYVRAVLDDLEFPGTDPGVRAALETELAARGPEALHARLAALDPGAAAHVEVRNGRRIVRALEVVTLTGRPFRATLPEHRYALPDVVQIGLRIERSDLDRRIAERVDAMWRDGFVAEVQRLAAAGLREGRTAARALGYRQVLRLLDGEITEDEARRLTVQATRRFARRQDAWFRRDPRIAWLTYDRPDLVAAAADLARRAPYPVED